MNQQSSPTTDSDLTRRVSDALTADERTAEAAIEVIAQRGLVTLRGGVKSLDVRRRAEEIAEAQPDVIEVINDLDVVPDKGDEDLVDASAVGYAASSSPAMVPEPDDE